MCPGVQSRRKTLGGRRREREGGGGDWLTFTFARTEVASLQIDAQKSGKTHGLPGFRSPAAGSSDENTGSSRCRWEMKPQTRGEMLQRCQLTFNLSKKITQKQSWDLEGRRVCSSARRMSPDLSPRVPADSTLSPPPLWSAPSLPSVSPQVLFFLTSLSSRRTILHSGGGEGGVERVGWGGGANMWSGQSRAEMERWSFRGGESYCAIEKTVKQVKSGLFKSHISVS